MLPLTLLGVGIGYAAAVVFHSPSSTRETQATPAHAPGETQQPGVRATATPDAEERIARLQLELDESTSERQRLEAELAALQENLAALERPSLREPRNAAASEPTASPRGGAARPGQPARGRWFDRKALEGVGLSSSEIDEVETRFERFQMDKLYIADEAKREGTFRGGAYHRDLAEVTREFRADLGPDGYDAYLYATGRDNRVFIKQVLSESPAGDAGVEEGDIVLRYAGERIFHTGEFQAATNAGELGEFVELEVERNGVTQRLRVERGPLGIRFGRKSLPPLTRR